ncbi:MAG: hydroxymethylbilane synthase [Francisellaceae bacterium]|nr:hydroxymethylbilane synthase [Francisellaceae bacterium]MBT6207302.1 hydroxymethylbilane synthase [Francisellaceae bacterium]MBT6538886.1 hydroxymethylbilane synthase [Francisellaceae bacterium]
MITDTITIATRTSKLALAQTQLFAKQLQSLYPQLQIKLKKIVTKGDKTLETPLYEHGGKGLFVKELEHALLDGTADIAIHSLKDMPYELPDNLEIVPVLERANPYDVLLSNKYQGLDALPLGAVVGTSSLRRHWQMQDLRPDIKIKLLRGNIHTRVNKLQGGEYDAIILAAAGLDRVDDICVTYQQDLTPQMMLPAVGQGILAAEFHHDNTKVKEMVSQLMDHHTVIRAMVERDLNKALGGSCQTPVAGFSVIKGGRICLQAWVGSKIGTYYRSNRECDLDECSMLGNIVAQDILSQGDIDWR